jgi:hypothetical protein
MGRLRRFAASAGFAAAAAYLLIAIALTWPLAAGLARDVPGDLGDPLLVMWILSWGCEQLRAIAGGDVGRITSYFDANIFHPAPLTLAYSEHLFAQVLQVAPIQLATANPILAYNLLFLSTFVLSGLGVFLLVRALTGSARGAFVGGLLYAFALYRWSHIAHVQVLSSQWMPFALYGFHLYFTTGRRRALAGAAAAIVMQNLSSGYFLLYFAPIGALFVAWELAVSGRWRTRRTWIELAIAALLIAILTLPFLLPYKRVRDTMQASRHVSEVIRYSADVYSYFTAAPRNRVWGDVARAHEKPEGELFPGIVTLLLASVAILAAMTTRPAMPSPGRARAPAWIIAVIAAFALVYASVAVTAIFSRRLDIDLVLFTIRVTNITRLLVPPIVALGALAWLSPVFRARAMAVARRPEAIVAAIVVVAWWLSLGPAPRVLGRPIELWSPYRVLYELVPGFDGVRVPARFAMIVTCGLSVLAGLAIARLPAGRTGFVVSAVAAIAFLIETNAAPLSINGVAPVRGYATPDARVYRPARAPAVYRELRNTPPNAVVLELPFGQPDYDVRSVFYSTVHWRRLANGYSGFFPDHYGRVQAVLSAGPRGDAIAWDMLRQLGVTHVVIHERAYLDDEGALFAEWLRSNGAVEVRRDAGDLLLALPE